MSNLYLTGGQLFISGTPISTTGTIVTTATTNAPTFVVSDTPKRKYWYKFFHHICPLCFSEETFRERVYYEEQPKPEDPAERHIDVDSVCGYHFM
jgi:hypothetical protein